MKILVVIPCYQQGQYLKRACASVEWQLREGDQAWVVWDEPGMPNSCDVPGRFALYDTGEKTPMGVSIARNLALDAAEFDWIKFLDADDVLAPFALESFRRTQIPDDVQVVAGQQVQVINGVVGHAVRAHWGQIERANPALVSGCFIRRTAFQALGGFDERIQFEEDWDFWLRIRERFGHEAFAEAEWPACYYWINDEERAAKKRSHMVDGVDVREYLRTRYKINPIR